MSSSVTLSKAPGVCSCRRILLDPHSITTVLKPMLGRVPCSETEIMLVFKADPGERFLSKGKGPLVIAHLRPLRPISLDNEDHQAGRLSWCGSNCLTKQRLR